MAAILDCPASIGVDVLDRKYHTLIIGSMLPLSEDALRLIGLGTS
jgi:hypothetical protein